MNTLYQKLVNKDQLTDAEAKLTCTPEFHEYFKKQLSRGKRHYYMLTFTIDANKGDSEEHYDEAEAYVASVASRSALQLLQYQYVREYTKKGIPHWHCLAVTTKPLKKDRFHYYKKKFGFVDISKNKAQQSSEIINYISKHSHPIVLL